MNKWTIDPGVAASLNGLCRVQRLRTFIGASCGLLLLALAIIPGPAVADTTEIPPELQGEPWRQITAQIEASRHEVRQVDGAWQAHTPAQDYVTEFTDAGPVFRLGRW